MSYDSWLTTPPLDKPEYCLVCGREYTEDDWDDSECPNCGDFRRTDEPPHYDC